MTISFTLGNIDNAFKTLAKDSKLEQKLQEKIVAKALLLDLKSKTPVATGHARDSWDIEETVLGFNLTNSADYIQQLNEGSSKQAPEHFIERTAMIYGTPLGQIVDHRDV